MSEKASIGNPRLYDLPLNAGYQGLAKYSRDPFGGVYVYFAIAKMDGGIFNTAGGSGWAIATLPEGYRPSYIATLTGHGADTRGGGSLVTASVAFDISTVGVIRVYTAGDTSALYTIKGIVVFQAS